MRVTRRALTLASVMTLTAVSLSACSDDDSSITFGYIPDYNGASLLAIADEQGLWEEHGLSAELKVFEDGPTQIQGLGAGDLDFGYIGPGAFWLPASGQTDIVAIDTLAYADRVIAQPGITSMQDLEGKKVAVPEGTSGEMALGLALEEAGMSEDDVEMVNMPPTTIVSAFSSGQVDAAGLWYPLIDEIKENVPDLEEVASTRDLEGSSFPTAFVAGDEVSDEVAKKTIAVLQEANDYRAEHPDETIAAAARLADVDKDAMAADASNIETLSTDSLVTKTQDGTVDEWLNDLGEFFVDSGELESVPDPDSYYRGDLYAEAADK
ncbi:MAG: aliphatic sulfonate ABC transporter substrate-binding protein [Nocardioidaceae bacterium]